MESLLAALLLFVVLAIAIAAIALPFLLLGWLVKARPGPPPVVRQAEWTDDDEIAARHHL